MPKKKETILNVAFGVPAISLVFTCTLVYFMKKPLADSYTIPLADYSNVSSNNDFLNQLSKTFDCKESSIFIEKNGSIRTDNSGNVLETYVWAKVISDSYGTFFCSVSLKDSSFLLKKIDEVETSTDISLSKVFEGIALWNFSVCSQGTMVSFSFGTDSVNEITKTANFDYLLQNNALVVITSDLSGEYHYVVVDYNSGSISRIYY